MHFKKLTNNKKHKLYYIILKININNNIKININMIIYYNNLWDITLKTNYNYDLKNKYRKIKLKS